MLPQIILLQRPSRLSCPDCAQVMRLYSCGTSLLDVCEACQGIWFEPEGFAEFKRTIDRFDLTQIQKIEGKYQLEEFQISTCPTCESALYESAYGYNSGVEFKKCSNCVGFWLPLDQVLRLVESAKIGQDIQSDVKGVLESLDEEAESAGRLKALVKLGRLLTQDVGFFVRRYFPKK